MLLVYLLPSIAWAAFILLLYSVPGDDIPSFDWMNLFSADKMAHVFVFLMMVLILQVALKRQPSSRRAANHAWQLALGFGLVYGGVLELFQGVYSTGRFSDPIDFAANSLGSVLGIATFTLIYGRELAFGK